MARKLKRSRPKQGERLTFLRKEAGYSQTELAEKIGTSQSSIAFWELSEKPPPSDMLPRLSKILGVTIEEIIGNNVSVPLKRGPKSKFQKKIEQLESLPKSKQKLVLDLLDTVLESQKA